MNVATGDTASRVAEECAYGGFGEARRLFRREQGF